MNNRHLRYITGLFGIFVISGSIITGNAAQADTSWMSRAMASRDLALGAEHTGSVMVGRDTVLNGTTVNGNVVTGREIRALDCQIQGSISAGSDVHLSGCDSVDAISAGRNVTLMKTTVTQSVSTGRDLTLQDATIQGNAYIGGQVTLNKAVIGNTLSLASHRLVLTGSNVNNIKMYLPQRHSFSNAGPLIASNTVMTGQGIVIGGNVIGASNGSFVNVGPQSVSSVNGFTIKGSPDQTTIITPENTIYVNGTNVSGNGPKHYEDYKATHPNAPSVSGPGWTSSNQTPMLQETQDTVQQIVELTENSLIQGKLYFESGRGKVVVHPGSRFTGSVEGGTIERL